MEIGRTLRQSRLRSGLTLRQLAERAGTSHSTLAAYEADAKMPRADTLIRLLAAAGWNVAVTSVDELGSKDRVERGEDLEALLRLTEHFPPVRRGPLGPTRFRARRMTVDLADRLVAVHRALDAAGLPHAFGGALALAWCTGEVRATMDVDVNVFVPVERAGDVLDSLPDGVVFNESDCDLLVRDGQVRVWWDRTPIDLFLNTSEFHEQAAARIRREPFMGGMLPFLACSDLAVFKAFFNRPKDWVDLGEMVAAGSLDAAAVVGTLALYLGGDDERIARLRALVLG